MNNIAAARKAAGYTQKQVAEIMHLAPSSYWAWEKGKARIDSVSILELSRLFGVSMSYLIGETDDPTPEKTASEKPTVKDDGLTLDLSGLTEENRQRVAGFVAALLMTQDK